MTARAIRDLVAGGETFAVELKRDVNDTELVEAVVCLANGGGGTLLIGVNDHRVVVGARPRHGAVTEPRRVEALISNNTRPALCVHVDVEKIEGLPVIAVAVPAATLPVATSGGR